MQFNVEDKAICTLTDSVVKIKYGPYLTSGGVEAYLAEWTEGVEKGRSSVVWAVDLQPAPKFMVGQEVTSPKGASFELVSGPFPVDETDTFWVVKDQAGFFDQVWERYMLPVV
ncbi:hypothetical protein OG306_33310 [Streptomyces sp. NBC_01241]|uniref:hypothetical protein n=1 Tax=Streptomyces sp. NBC_01241 TaxID=2903794 RepID=UPI00352D08B1|nr:hypothetical protein OG306_33310 [Streptomyces sp. NBC_01241]